MKNPLVNKRFDLIEHTADIGLTAYGQNLAEAFSNAAYGLFSIITDLRKVRKVESRTIELQEKEPRGPSLRLVESFNLSV